MTVLITLFAIIAVLFYLLWALLDSSKTYIVADWKNNISLRVVTYNGFLDDNIKVYRKKYFIVYEKTDDHTYGVKGTELKMDREALKNHNYKFNMSKGTVIFGNGSVYNISEEKLEIKEGHTIPSHSSVSVADIEAFIKKAKNKENGQSITVNGNRLESRYDKATGQSWIDVSNDNDRGAIPRQQCTRIVPDKEQRYYMLEECTQKWDYPLIPMYKDK